jgi:hypothetical protein
MRPERARNEGTTGPKRLDDTHERARYMYGQGVMKRGRGRGRQIEGGRNGGRDVGRDMENGGAR